MVLHHAFEEASLRGVPLRAVSAQHDENQLAQAQLSRRLARWTRLYPEVQVEPNVTRGTIDEYLADNAASGQLFVADSHTVDRQRGANNMGCSVLTVRCGNL